MERKEKGFFRKLFAVLVSLAVHVAIVLSLFPYVERIGAAGGVGWADELVLAQGEETSSGSIGEGGKVEEQDTEAPTALNITLVYVEPTPPEPEPEEVEYLPEEEEPEPEEEEIVEEEPEPEETEIAEELPVAEESVVEQETTTASIEAPGDGGQGGLQETPVGSEFGNADAGSGSGNADSGETGVGVPGGELRGLLEGWTLIGTNGFSDGSTSANRDNQRQDIPWRVYYAPNGTLRARWQRYGTIRAHGAWGYHWYEESGRWTVEGDLLCQNIRRWGSDSTQCFNVRRLGNDIAMYYARCTGVFRCWPDRLGPDGVVRQGRHLRD